MKNKKITLALVILLCAGLVLILGACSSEPQATINPPAGESEAIHPPSQPNEETEPNEIIDTLETVSLIGRWKMVDVIVEDGTITQAEIDEYIAERHSNTRLVFFPDHTGSIIFLNLDSVFLFRDQVAETPSWVIETLFWAAEVDRELSRHLNWDLLVEMNDFTWTEDGRIIDGVVEDTFTISGGRLYLHIYEDLTYVFALERPLEPIESISSSALVGRWESEDIFFLVPDWYVDVQEQMRDDFIEYEFWADHTAQAFIRFHDGQTENLAFSWAIENGMVVIDLEDGTTSKALIRLTDSSLIMFDFDGILENMTLLRRVN